MSVASEPLEAARRAAATSDRFQGTQAEMRSIRDALRALIQWADSQEEAKQHVHATLIRWRHRSLWSLWRNRHNFVWVPPDWPEAVTVTAGTKPDA